MSWGRKNSHKMGKLYYSAKLYVKKSQNLNKELFTKYINYQNKLEVKCKIKREIVIGVWNAGDLVAN